MYKFFFDLNLQVKKLVINSILEFPRELARRIEAICGTKSLEIYQSKISENLPEVFEPDAEFYPLTLIYGDLTATVNSFYECGVYGNKIAEQVLKIYGPRIEINLKNYLRE